MATKPAATNQMILPGLESALCKCGCGTYFMRAARGRRQEYLNGTHKKRQARRLAKERQTDTTVRLAPKGYLYLNAIDNREIAALWDAMDPSEREVIEVLCRTGLQPEELSKAVEGLFNKMWCC